MSDFPAAYLTERNIGFSFPDTDREALQALSDDDVALCVFALLECVLAVIFSAC